MAIMVSTWRYVARKKHKTAGDYAIVGWNTVAQVHNTYSALQNIPRALDGLGGFFGGSGGGSGGSDDNKWLIVIALVVLAVVGGCLTTYGIIQRTRRSVLLKATAG